MSNLSPGAVISHYRIIELIARGGMGEVYKATDTRLGRTVAIKVPGDTIVEDNKAKRRFMREAQAASRLSHPNICTIFEVGEDEGRLFIVMEYIEGPTLHQTITSSPLAVESTLRLAIQIADALEAAHQSGIIHRDLKPSNVIINPRAMAVILDFGLAKRLRENESADEASPTIMQSLTTEATIVGTVAYMSPEQVRGQRLDARSDIFSFGILLYEMLTGSRPFTGVGQIEIMHAIVHDEPPSIRMLRPEIDEGLVRIIARAMAKDPAARYQTMHEVKQDLWQLVRDRGYDLSGAITAATSSPGRSGLKTEGLRSRQQLLSRRALWILAGALVLGAAAIYFVLTKGSSNEDALSAIESRTLVSWKSDLGDIVTSRGRFSRDGRLIVYAATEQGNTDLWIKQVSGAEPVPVPGTQDGWVDSSPIFSPDAEQIAFISNRGGQFGIWTIPILGGTPQLRATLEPGRRSLVAWSRDGRSIYYELNQNIYLLNLETGEQRRLTDFPATQIIERMFSLSPDERRIAYVEIQNGQQDIWVRPLGAGAPVRVTNDAARDWNPIWHADGERIIYNSVRGGVAQICLAFLDGREPRQITFNDSDSQVSDVSEDGRRILYSVSRDEADLWMVRVDSGSIAPVTTEVGVELWPDLSADGSKIAYQASRMQSIGTNLLSGTILSRELRGQSGQAGQGRALQLASGGFAPQWSPDGEQIAFLRLEDDENSLWLAPASGGEAMRLSAPGVVFGGFSRLPYNRLQARDYSWSSDGRRVVYVARRDGVSNIWISGRDGSGETKVTANSDPALQIFSPLWSRDSRLIAYLSFSSGRAAAQGAARWGVWVAAEGENGSDRLLYENESALRIVGWSADGQDLIIKVIDSRRDTVSTPVAVSLYRLSASGGPTRPMARLESTYFHNLQLSKDGRSIAYVTRAENVDHLEIRSVQGGPARRILRSDDPLSYIANLTWSPDGQTICYAKQTNTRSISMIDRFK